ncbi:hypothetical protein SprV_0100152800 [Sparganum proliferum]
MAFMVSKPYRCRQKPKVRVTSHKCLDARMQTVRRFQRTVSTNGPAPIGPVGHLQTQCVNNRTAPASSPNLTLSPNPATTANPVTANHTVAAPPPSVTHVISTASTTLSTTATRSNNTATSRTSPTVGMTFDVPSPAAITTSIPTSSDVDSVHTCPHCDRTSTSPIGLIGHLRINHTEIGKPVP